MTDLATNALYYGDTLNILRRYLPDAAVDLVSRNGGVGLRLGVGFAIEGRTSWYATRS